MFLGWLIGQSFLKVPWVDIGPQPVTSIVLMSGMAAIVAAGTVDILGDIRPALVRSIGRTAGSVAAVMFLVTLAFNVTKGVSAPVLATTLVANSLGTGIETAIGLYLYRGRSSASKFRNTSAERDTQ